MSKIKRCITVLALCCMMIVSIAHALAPALCIWSSGGCTTMVVSSGEGWGMVMGCTDGTGGTWGGAGSWGGDCPTSWINYPYGMEV